MFGQAILRSSLWLVSLWAVLIIGIIGCGGDDDDANANDWVGTWSYETEDDQILEQALAESLGAAGMNVSIVTNNFTFNSDGTMEAEFTFEVEYKEGVSKISHKYSQKYTGTYSLSGTNFTLATRIETTMTIEGEESFTVRDTGEGAGTWYRKENTLTLNGDDSAITIFSGDTIIFKKK